ncbi:MAG: 2Fe-2S iron-sulfur cluster-binding protein [Desulfarculaceae bacterium]|jgi:formate dehydrogenase major subunit
MEPQKEIRLTINGQEVQVPDGTTVLDAARLIGVRIPTLCHHPNLTPWGGCRLCVVEVDSAPKLVASCVTPVRAGMNVVTSNPRIVETRRTILEFMFAERNHYCMFCAQSGDCELQSLAYEYQVDHLGVPPLEDHYPTDITHGDLVIDHNRCVLCGRCVRACRELAGNSVLDFHNRGGRTVIGVDMAQGLGDSTCISCGLCAQVCPTGAIFSRYRTHYAVKGKVKTWRAVKSWCPQCGQLCQALYLVKDNNLLKVEGPLPSDDPDRGQLCRRGRFDPLKTEVPRLHKPMVKDGKGVWKAVSWDEALEQVAAGLNSQDGGVLGLASSGCSCEELARFRDLMDSSMNGTYLDTWDGSHYRTISQATRKLSPAWQESPWQALSQADFILEVGADPSITHPLVRSLSRRAVLENKARLAIIGQEKGVGAEEALHLAASDDDISKWLKALLVQVGIGTKPAKKKGGPAAAPEVAELAGLWQKASQPLLIAGPGLTGLDGGEGLESALALAKTKLNKNNIWPLIILKPAGNSMGAWQLGLASDQVLKSGRKLRSGLLLLAEEGLPENGWLERLVDLKFLAALTPYFFPKLAELAHVLLPRPTWLEVTGTYFNSQGTARRTLERVLDLPPGVPSTQDTLAALTEKTGWSDLREEAS